MKIPFVGSSYQARSLNADAQRSVNCYLEYDNSSPRAPIALYGTPGLALRFTFGAVGGPFRGAVVAGSYAFAVSNNTVFRISVAAGVYTATALGTIGTTSGQLGIATDGTQVLIVDGTGGWIASVTTLTRIADPDFPIGVKAAAYMDGYFVVAADGTGRFYINETPGDGTAWNATDFATAEGASDATLQLLVSHRELWIAGSDTIEIWVNTGNPDFPFERSGNTFLETGTSAAASVALMDNTVYWLGQQKNGNGLVFRAQGYTPQRISTHAIERAIQGYSTISDAVGYTYQIEGHSFYVLTFPTGNATWVYDAATNEWHEWLYRDPFTNSLGRHRSSGCFFFNNEQLVGDYQNGKVYALDLDVYTDYVDPILRLRTSQTLERDQKRLFYSSLQVDMETGVGLATGQGSDPLLMLRWSNDGGHTWSNQRTATVGLAGEYGMRARFTRLGQGRNRVWEISMTDPVKFAILGADVDVTRGES